MIIIYVVSVFTGRPDPSKLQDTTFTMADFRQETIALKQVRWWNNYRYMGLALVIICAILLIVFS